MVNKKLKKCASLFLVMSMAVSILAGCGSKNETEKAQTTTENTGETTEASATDNTAESASDESGEVKKITYFTPKVPSDDVLAIFQELAEEYKKGITLNLSLKQRTQMVMIRNYVLWQQLMNFRNCLT